MKTVSPSVSVVMAAYNAAPHIDRAVKTFLGQTYTNATLYICDDCSKDNTLEIARRYALQYPNIIVLHNEQNEGFVGTMNRLFHAAQGDYICILDSDDWMADNRIEQQLKIISDYDADAVLSEYIHTDGSNMTYGAFKYAQPTQIMASNKNVVGSSGSLMMSKRVQQNIIGYHTYFADAFCADLYMIYKIARDFRLFYDPSHLYYYVQTPGSMTQVFDLYKLSKLYLAVELVTEQKKGGKDLLELGEYDELEKRRLFIAADRKWKSSQYQLYAARYTDQKYLKEALTMSLKAIVNNPANFDAYRSLVYGLKSAFGRLLQ